MNKSLKRYPGLRNLEAGLRSVLLQNGCLTENIRIAERHPNIYTSSFPSEIVTCTTSADRTIKFFLKYYNGEIMRDVSHGHRGGIEYEAKVYKYILKTAALSTVKFYGTYHDPENGGIWLVLEYLDDSGRVFLVSDHNAAPEAARWIGRFHAINEKRMPEMRLPFLFAYHTEYYADWALRTLEYAASLHKRFPWLETVCNQFQGLIPVLMKSPQTIIHGEYYQCNILYHNGDIYPVDWESAAVSQGEIDLAFFMDGCSEEMFQECKQAYQRTRWPKGSPSNIDQTIDIARLYAQFRWLGEWPSVTVHKDSLPRFERLRTLGERLKLL